MVARVLIEFSLDSHIYAMAMPRPTPQMFLCAHLQSNGNGKSINVAGNSGGKQSQSTTRIIIINRNKIEEK